jgi:hypothetical protein
VSPDFPTAARIWSARWQLAGVDIDGVLAVDPIVLGYLLEVLGPVDVDGRSIDSGNAASFFLQDVYAEYPDRDERDRVQRRFIDAVFTKLVAGGGDPRGLVEAVVRGAQEGRVLVAMPGSAEQRLLERESIGGALRAPRDRPFIGLVINDAGGSKLDPYTTRTVEYARGACTGDARTSTVTVTLGNDAPAEGLPDYVVARADRPSGPVSPGQRRAYVSVYATPGSQLLSSRLAGKPAAVESRTEKGLPVFSTYLELGPDQEETLTLRLAEPPRSGPAVVRTQPLVKQPTVTIRDDSCAS